MIHLVKSALIVLAVLLFPVWLVQVACGRIADLIGQRRRVSMLKGDQ